MHHILQSAAASGCSSSVEIALLQECYSWRGSTLQIGSCAWQVLGEVDNGTAICVRIGARTRLQDWGTAQRTTFAKTSEALYVTSYLPDSGYDLQGYETTIRHVDNIVRCHRGEDGSDEEW